MKFLLAQINPVVGDLEGNAKKILYIASKASSISADFVLTPELSLLGYPVESNTLKMLETYKVKFKISTIKIPETSSSNFRLNFNCSNLPASLIDIVKKNNLYESTKLVE